MDNRVNELRKQLGKTMKELSVETGIGLSTISNHENGYSTPKKENAKILADYFGVSIPYLLGLDDTPTLVNSRGTIPANWMQELFSISHKKSELLQEYMELDKKEKAILKQITEN